MTCKHCGEHMEGDGYTRVLHCPNTLVDTSFHEPDADPVYCTRVIDSLKDVRPYMTITHGFTRFHVAESLVKMLGGKRVDHERKAGRLLARARREGIVRWPPGRVRSTYYYFVAQ